MKSTLDKTENRMSYLTVVTEASESGRIHGKGLSAAG